MLSSPIPAVVLAVGFTLPVMALELSDLSLPMTRSAADKALSKDYSYRVLEDMTVRRTWELRNRTVSVDFSPKDDDTAIVIFVDYTRPVENTEADEDVTKLLGRAPGSWLALKPERADKLGMERAEGFKLSSGRYVFRECDRKGRVARLAYYASAPKAARWDLSDDARSDGKTAMGSRTVASSTEFLWRDEERRRGVSASSSPESLASAAAAVVAEGRGEGASSPKPDMLPRPEEPVDLVSQMKDFVAKLTPTHYAIGGAVVAFLLLLRFVARARAARRRAMVANYIMNHGKINVTGKAKQ